MRPPQQVHRGIERVRHDYHIWSGAGRQIDPRENFVVIFDSQEANASFRFQDLRQAKVAPSVGLEKEYLH